MKYTNATPLVVIFGRANVGKSTLFNCLLEKRQALVSAVAGTTRDANIGETEWRGRKFRLVDTGGITEIKNLAAEAGNKGNASLGGPTGDIDAKVQAQARVYLKRSDLILFVVDARDGLLAQDKEMAALVKKIPPAHHRARKTDAEECLPHAKADRMVKSTVPCGSLKQNSRILLVANKADNPVLRRETAEFNRLGLGEPLAVSAANGAGTGDLLDAIIDKLFDIDVKIPGSGKRGAGNGYIGHETAYLDIESEKPAAENQMPIRVCIVGRPNVGKSSLINRLIGDERIIVSPAPHTTREPQNIEIDHNNRRITFVDTAGLSRQGQKSARALKTKYSLEKLSIAKSLEALAKSDIALLVVDIAAGIDRQEQKIVDEILERKASLVIIANKWDMIREKDVKRFNNYISSHLPFIAWAPIHFCSALTGEKVHKIFELIFKADEARSTHISDNALGHFLNKIIKRHRPALGKFAKRPHIHDFKQVGVRPPVFSLRIGAKETLQDSYVKYIENRLREKFGFFGTPIMVWVEKNKNIHGRTEYYNDK